MKLKIYKYITWLLLWILSKPLCYATSLPWDAKTLQYKENNILPVFNLDTYLFRAKSCDKMELQVFRRGSVVYRLEMLGPSQAEGPVTRVTLNDLNGNEVGDEEVADPEGLIECEPFKSFYVHWSQGIFLFGSGSVPHENILSSMDIGNGGTEMYDYMEMKADRFDNSVIAEVEWLPGFINGISSIPGKSFTPEDNVLLYDYNDTCIQFTKSSSGSTIIEFGIPFYLSGKEINVIVIIDPDSLCEQNGLGGDNVMNLYIAHDQNDACNSKILQECSYTGEDSLMDKRSCRYTCSCVGNTCSSGMMHIKHAESSLEVCELLVASQTF